MLYWYESDSNNVRATPVSMQPFILPNKNLQELEYIQVGYSKKAYIED